MLTNDVVSFEQLGPDIEDMTLQKVRNYQTYHYVNMGRSSSLDADICDEEFADLVRPKKSSTSIRN